MDIKAPEPNQSLQMLANLFTDALPPALPPMQFQSGLLPNFFHNWKLGQLERASEREAKIAENHNRNAKAKLDTIQSFLTFQARTADMFKELEHREAMRRGEREIGTEQLNKLRMENQILFYDAKIGEMEFKKREMEFKEEYENKKNAD